MKVKDFCMCFILKTIFSNQNFAEFSTLKITVKDVKIFSLKKVFQSTIKRTMIKSLTFGSCLN